MAFNTVGCGRSTAGLTKQFGTTKNDCATAVVLDSQGNIYLVGNTDGNLFGPNLGGTDVFVVKYSAEGNREWKFCFGSDQDDCANSACVSFKKSCYNGGKYARICPEAICWRISDRKIILFRLKCALVREEMEL